jgi:hypothetical protein
VVERGRRPLITFASDAHTADAGQQLYEAKQWPSTSASAKAVTRGLLDPLECTVEDRRILPVVATHGFLRECHGG